MKGTGGTTGGSGVFLNSGTTVIATTGDASIEGSSRLGTGIKMFNRIASANGNVVLRGTTSSTTNQEAGIFSSAVVTGKNIDMIASATAATGNVLGYYGAGGTFNASQQLNLMGNSVNANGLYTFTGSFSSGSGMTISGTSVNGSGVGLDNNVSISNSGAGGITMTGSASTTRDAIGMGGVAITNSGGDVVLNAITGNIGTSVGNPSAWGGVNRTNSIANSGTGKVQITAGNGSVTNTGAIDGTVLSITQNADADVLVRTSGAGNITSPRVVNGGAGNVVIAAGTGLDRGFGNGGQVKTVSGNTITNGSGKTYIYTGNANDTSALSNLGGFAAGLHLSTIGTAHKNAASNKAYADGPILDGANLQVMFREKVTLNADAVLSGNVTIRYGDVVDSSNLKAALLAANTNALIGEFSQASNAGTFKILKSDIASDATVSVATAVSNAAHLSTSGQLKVNPIGYSMDITGANYKLDGIAAKLKVDQKDLTMSGIKANDRVYNGDAAVAVNAAGVIKAGLVGSDVVSLVNVTGTFRNDANTADDKNVKLLEGVAAAKTVALTSIYGGADRNNYRIIDQTTASAVILQRPLTIDTGTVANKMADGTTSATVIPGALNNLVAGEALGVLATANFSDANAGTAKIVTASYTLQNGSNGLASNYILNSAAPNPDNRLRGTIVSSVNPIVNPNPLPLNNNTGSRVRTVSGSGSSGAATGVLDDQHLNQAQDVCSDLNPENCECQASVISSIEICFAPKSVAATKEEK